jgi:hypothetical protein
MKSDRFPSARRQPRPAAQLPLRATMCLLLAVALNPRASLGADGRLDLSVVDAATQSLVPCRVHLSDPEGKPVKAPELPFWRDHFVCTGRVALALAPGIYQWQIERGPEWSRATGAVTIASGSTAAATNTLRHQFDLRAEGWWAGETHVHRPLPEISLLMAAEDLPIAHVITWWNATNPWRPADLPPVLPVPVGPDRFQFPLGGEDERDGGALLFLDLPSPLEITGGTRHFPSSLTYARQARARGARWIEAEKPFWWDLPMWVAHGVIDSVGLAHNHLHRGGVLENEAWGRPRDRDRYPGPQGNGRYTQDIYYHLLNCGVRLPPGAGAASGVLPNPVGYNRAFVHVEGPLSYAKWRDGLLAGRSFVSNGPLLRTKANGFFPGQVLRTNGSLEIRLEGRLDSADPIAAVELVRNGRLERIQLPFTFTMAESGWFLVRAVADVPHTFRFASTAPWYVEIGGQPLKPQRASARYFIDWCNERLARLESQAAPPAAEKEQVLQPWREALKFWQARLAESR